MFKKRPITTKRATGILIEVRSCSALVCIGIYLKSVLRYNFLILGTSPPDTRYLREQWCEDSWLFFESERCARKRKSLGNSDIDVCGHHHHLLLFLLLVLLHVY